MVEESVVQASIRLVDSALRAAIGFGRGITIGLVDRRFGIRGAVVELVADSSRPETLMQSRSHRRRMAENAKNEHKTMGGCGKQRVGRMNE